MMMPGFVTIIIIEVSYDRKKFSSAQNVMDVSFFVVKDSLDRVQLTAIDRSLGFSNA